MAKKNTKKFKIVQEKLRRIRELNDLNRTIRITIRDEGLTSGGNPSEYGSILESGYHNVNGRDYRFLGPALKSYEKEFRKEYPTFIKSVIDFKSSKKESGKRRTANEILDHMSEYGKAGVDRVIEYVLYEMQQYPDRNRKNATLLETGSLLDSIVYEILDKNGNVLRRGQ